MNTLEKIRPRHAHKINDERKLNELFYQQEHSETVKLNMLKEFEKHKKIINILPIFKNQSYLKTLQFYKQFGINSVYSNGGVLDESRPNSPQTLMHQTIEGTQSESSNSENFESESYKFCEENIPLDLTKEEFTIHSTIESLLKDAMRHKNQALLSHEKVINGCEDISIAFRQLIQYFLTK